jgi:RNA polymerase sigma factor (sigma-70 family)
VNASFAVQLEREVLNVNVEELVTLSRDGEIAAFEQLVRRFQEMAFGYARVLCGDPHLAEDATQQAFLVAFMNLANLREPARFGGWLRGIVRFETFRLFRSSRPCSDTSAQLETLIDTRPGPAERAEVRESLKRVTSALAALPDRERSVATLYYLHDQSQREVARFLNLTVSTVNNRLRSARTHLRNGGLLTMTIPTHHETPDFSSRVGTILRATGPVLEARFAPDHRPALLGSVSIDSDEASPLATAFVAQYFDDDIVRLVIPERTNGAKAIGADAKVRDQGIPVGTALEQATIREIVVAQIHSGPRGHIVETGIKVIDAFASITSGGSVALAGDMNVGKFVVLEELFHRLAASNVGLSVFVFLQVPDEVGAVHRLAQQHSGTLNATFLPVKDASPHALADVLKRVDSVIVMSRNLGEKQLYPAIDASASWSNVLPEADRAIIESAKRILQDPAKEELLTNYLTQPFFVAKPFTNRPGLIVPRVTTIADLTRIVSGDLTLAGADLYMTGALQGA